MRNICESIRKKYNRGDWSKVCICRNILARVETYKVAYPPRRSVFVVVTAVMGKERSKASEFPGVVRSRPSA